MREKVTRDWTPEATALFRRFADQYGLTYEEDLKAPVEVLWCFPAQANLVQPIVLGLQNYDELNFGVGKFWSYFFPFEHQAASVENLLNA